MTLGELTRRVAGELLHASSETSITGFATDSRQVEPGNIFLAIKGAQVDGHDFVKGVVQNGAVASLVERTTDAPAIKVDNVVEAIARLGRSLRDEFTGPVVGVTGSHGKTTTKELVAAALSPRGPVIKNVGNRNSEFTSPLVWFDRDPEAWSAVIEMGMRGAGQIAHLANVHRPTVGLITVIGTAHLEKVGSREGIARAKAELLDSMDSDGVSVLWADDEYLDDLRQHAPGRVRTFGWNQDADCQVLGYRAVGWNAGVIRGTLEGKAFEVELPAGGRHQAQNVAAALLVADTLGVDLDQAAAALRQAELPPMRMEVREWNGATILLDTYNASPDSTIAALNALIEGPGSGRRLAVLGEMRELGAFEESGHRSVGRVLGHLPVDSVFFAGGNARLIRDEAIEHGLPSQKAFGTDQLDLAAVHEFLKGVLPGDVVLIKGSRALGLEAALDG